MAGPSPLMTRDIVVRVGGRPGDFVGRKAAAEISGGVLDGDGEGRSIGDAAEEADVFRRGRSLPAIRRLPGSPSWRRRPRPLLLIICAVCSATELPKMVKPSGTRPATSSAAQSMTVRRSAPGWEFGDFGRQAERRDAVGAGGDAEPDLLSHGAAV